MPVASAATACEDFFNINDEAAASEDPGASTPLESHTAVRPRAESPPEAGSRKARRSVFSMAGEEMLGPSGSTRAGLDLPNASCCSDQAKGRIPTTGPRRSRSPTHTGTTWPSGSGSAAGGAGRRRRWPLDRPVSALRRGTVTSSPTCWSKVDGKYITSRYGSLACVSVGLSECWEEALRARSSSRTS
jgi:hypothetical protein